MWEEFLAELLVVLRQYLMKVSVYSISHMINAFCLVWKGWISFSSDIVIPYFIFNLSEK